MSLTNTVSLYVYVFTCRQLLLERGWLEMVKLRNFQRYSKKIMCQDDLHNTLNDCFWLATRHMLSFHLCDSITNWEMSTLGYRHNLMKGTEESLKLRNDRTWQLESLAYGDDPVTNLLRLIKMICRVWSWFLMIYIGGLKHEFCFSHHIGNVIIPTDFQSIIFQRGRAQPPTSIGRFNELFGSIYIVYTLW